jgi:hypothetical protein
MVQSCCGDACKEAGLGQRSAKFTPGYLSARDGAGSARYLQRADGTRIEPISVGNPPREARSANERKHVDATIVPTRAVREEPSRASKRDGASAMSSAQCSQMAAQSGSKTRALHGRGTCSGYQGTWQRTSRYTRPADNSTIVGPTVYGGTGGGHQDISETRSQTWTTSVSMDFGFADVISMGLSFSSEESCQIEDSSTYSFNIPPGQSGDIAWSAFLQCETGKRLLFVLGHCRASTNPVPCRHILL